MVVLGYFPGNFAKPTLHQLQKCNRTIPHDTREIPRENAQEKGGHTTQTPTTFCCSDRGNSGGSSSSIRDATVISDALFRSPRRPPKIFPICLTHCADGISPGNRVDLVEGNAADGTRMCHRVASVKAARRQTGRTHDRKSWFQATRGTQPSASRPAARPSRSFAAGMLNCRRLHAQYSWGRRLRPGCLRDTAGNRLQSRRYRAGFVLHR